MTVLRKAYAARVKALPDSDGVKGRFEALVSVFGNVDLQGDRVMPGAFDESLKSWRASGDPIPVAYSHDWSPFGIIGSADPADVVASGEGLKMIGSLDIETNPTALQVYSLMRRRIVKEFSFGYEVGAERSASDGANELVRVHLIEAGPTLKGANPATELLGVKTAEAVRQAVSMTQADESNTDMMDAAWLCANEAIAEGQSTDEATMATARRLRGWKSAIGVHHTETYRGTWDGGAQEAALASDTSAATLRRMYAWVDPEGDPTAKSSYKFPHHTVSDGEPGGANMAACSAVVAALNGGRGGSSIPDGDRAGVHAHVAAHMRDGGMAPDEVPPLKSYESVGTVYVDVVPRIVDGKAGRTISGKNEGKIRSAITALEEVLASLGEEPTSDGASSSSTQVKAAEESGTEEPGANDTLRYRALIAELSA